MSEIPGAATGDVLILRSVGIDVGSSTSHLAFSRLVLERQGTRLSSAYAVVEREVLHLSPVMLTPYSGPLEIDAAALGAFIESAYAEAGIAPSQVDSGALIVTGNAALKTNAERIARVAAADAGRFVCATAGPHLEARLAAHGSGAVERSRDGSTVLSVDIGGGTTKLATVRDGKILETAAVAVGARIVVIDGRGRVSRIEPAALAVARAAGVALELGRPLSADDRRALARVLADVIVATISARRFHGLARELLVTDEIVLPQHIDVLQLSGGVAEYVHARESRDLGDLGPSLGAELRARLADPALPPLAADGEGIRATVIGAGQWSLQVSGSTIFLSEPGILPVRDLRVVRPSLDALDAVSIGRAIADALARDRAEGGDGAVALSLHARVEPSYVRLRELAAGIAAGVRALDPGHPLVLLFDADLGRSVGAILSEEMLPGRRVAAIDQVRVDDLDRVDVGAPLAAGAAVPVVVKTLVFGAVRPRATVDRAARTAIA